MTGQIAIKNTERLGWFWSSHVLLVIKNLDEGLLEKKKRISVLRLER